MSVILPNKAIGAHLLLFESLTHFPSLVVLDVRVEYFRPFFARLFRHDHFDLGLVDRFDRHFGRFALRGQVVNG